MEKSFEQFLVDEVRLIREGVDDLKVQVTDLHLKMTEYAPKEAVEEVKKSNEKKCEECKTGNANDHRSLTGWIIGAYLFIMTTAVTLFTMLFNSKK